LKVGLEERRWYKECRRCGTEAVRRQGVEKLAKTAKNGEKTVKKPAKTDVLGRRSINSCPIDSVVKLVDCRSLGGSESVSFVVIGLVVLE
jgi:hypothetical protein